MRRRRTVSVWPTFADLMTVLAVTGLLSALTLLELHPNLEHVIAENSTLRRENEELEDEKLQVEMELADLVKQARINQRMVAAIAAAQGVVDQLGSELSRKGDVDLDLDQSVRFGDNLASFKRNQSTPEFNANAEQLLKAYCQSVESVLSEDFEGFGSRRQFFVVQVEGHTDSLQAPGFPHFNWPLSAERAANFLVVMKDPEVCPGGRSLNLRPIGLADTLPSPGSYSATRRIALRLVPRYDAIIRAIAAAENDDVAPGSVSSGAI